MRILEKITDFWVVIVLLITSVLCFVNYSPGTWLSGWDTLHPEFNFSLYFSRMLSVWQEHQGLGVVASQSHAAELPRLLFYYPLSFILPDSFLRYFYFFTTLIAGTLGAYYFLKNIVFKYIELAKARAFSFAGALVYLLNLGTLQHFYVPLEMFAHHFATLPWVLLTSTKYLEQGGFKNLALVGLMAFLVAPIAHTATLFYVFFSLLAVYLLTLAWISRKAFKRAFIILASFLVLNSYWLLPNVYYVLTQGENVSASKIHTQFTDKAFLTGQKFGGITNTAFLKNFLFDWGEYDEASGKFIDLFDEWQPHLSRFIPFLAGYLVFILVIFGLINSVARSTQERKYALSFLPIGVISFVLIANHNIVSEAIFGLFEKSFPVVREALRFPFTKLSIILALCYAVFTSLALFYLTSFLERFVRRGEKILPIIVSGLLAVLLIVYMLPAFGGNLISPSMKAKIPEDYFQAFNWFDDQDTETRIATFPMDTFWGWAYYAWGNEGAGFRWFGIPQSTLDREFDRWNPYNENFYWEASNALYANNYPLFESIFDKYQINWLYFDESIISPWSPKSLYKDELNHYLATSEKFTLEKEFGKIKIYKVKLNTPVNNYVFLAADLPAVGPVYEWNNYDNAYAGFGNYVSELKDAYYPFRSLFTGKTQKNLEFKIEKKGDNYVLRSQLPGQVRGWNLQLPGLTDVELLYVDKDNFQNSKTFVPEVSLSEDFLEIKFPKIDGYYSGIIDPAQDQGTKAAKNCNNKKTGVAKNQIILDGDNKVKRLIARDTNNCSTAFWLEHLPHDLSYLITINSRNVRGKSLLFWLENLNVRKSDQEAYLSQNKTWQTSYFIQPPMETDGSGYALHFDNISIGSKEAVNDLAQVSIQPFPYRFLTSIYLHPEIQEPKLQTLSTVQTEHETPDMYKVSFAEPPTGTLVLSQAYHTGWRAYKGHYGYLSPLLGTEIKDHVKVNNWENGWQLPKDTTKITILFLPQYLQFLGYFLALGSIIALFVPQVRRKLTN